MAMNCVELMNYINLIFFYYPCNPANLPVIQLNFYTPGVIGCTGKQSFYNPSCKGTCTLILFQDNINFKAGINIASVLSVHCFKK